MPGDLPKIWKLFEKLRSQGFGLGPEDYAALGQVLQAGFGLQSLDELRQICCILWAKSREQREQLQRRFDELRQLGESDTELNRLPSDKQASIPESIPRKSNQKPATEVVQLLPVLPLSRTPPTLGGFEKPHFQFTTSYPVSAKDGRAFQQQWRRLRWLGPPIEADVPATIAARCRSQFPVKVILQARRISHSLLLLVDREGSMAPFHPFCDEICDTLLEQGSHSGLTIFYFHDVPVRNEDPSLYELFKQTYNPMLPTLDGLVSGVHPLRNGSLYEKRDLLEHRPTRWVLEQFASQSLVVVISDAGAARGHYDPRRLYDTIGFIRALQALEACYVWLNPLPKHCWKYSTAGQVERHVPMFPLEPDGLQQAIQVLRGRPQPLECPV